MEKFSPCGLIGLAPMAGPGDSGFRRICKENGADYTVSEMISAKAIRFGSEKTFELAAYSPYETPILLQLFGSDPDSIEYASKFVTEHYQPCGIDLNMGCPAPKIFNNGDGSALMKNPSLAFSIVKSACRGTSLPVSVKMRIGIDSPDDSIVDFAKGVEQAGAAFITVHGRTREQFYSGAANYDYIARVKNAVSIPVIANGDIIDGPSAKHVLDVTRADGLMLARGALGSPYVFNEIKNYLSSGSVSDVTLEERFATCLKHLSYTIEDKGEEKAAVEFRKHMLWYLKGIYGSSSYKVQAGRINSYADCVDLIQTILSDQKNKPLQ